MSKLSFNEFSMKYPSLVKRLKDPQRLGHYIVCGYCHAFHETGRGKREYCRFVGPTPLSVSSGDIAFIDDDDDNRITYSWRA